MLFIREGIRSMKMEELIIVVAPSVLHECTLVCADFLKQHRQRVEPGGVIIGTFDGCVASVKQLLLDEQAECTPVSIRFSPNAFSRAEKLVAQHNTEKPDPWFILGTWHGHPPGYTTFSSTDEATLFREQLRLRTDDPSLALAPWVHFIFPNYGLDPSKFRAFTMQLSSSYRFGEEQLPTDALLMKRLASEVENGTNLGLLVADADGQRWQLGYYHPDNFRRHLNKEITIAGLWRYFPFPRIAHEFEKVFLENFCQKIRSQRFRYLRLLQHSDKTGLLVQQLECQRNSGGWDLTKVITFTEIGIQLKDEK